MYSSFQSHFGLISTCGTLNPACIREHLSIPFWSDFNSRSDFSKSSQKKIFQSHFGLISTFPTKLSSSVVIVSFQSHFGLISTEDNKYKRRLIALSFNPILVWFQPCLPPSQSPTYSLSIPFWSDFNKAICLKVLQRLTDFQSHFGLISTVPYKKKEFDVIVIFQSHFGLISTLLWVAF